MDKRCSIKVNFSDNHTNFYDAWQYVTKTDPDYIRMDSYLDLRTSISSHTKKVTNTKCERAEKPIDFTVKKKRNLNPTDTFENILANNSLSELEFFYIVKAQKNKGKTDLVLYILRNTDKIKNLST